MIGCQLAFTLRTGIAGKGSTSMAGKNFWVAQDGHVVSLISPQNITGGANGTVFNMAGYNHASIIIQQGALAAANTAILLYACTDSSGSNPTAIPFSLFTQETAGLTNDVLSTRQAVTAAGYAPTANANTFYVAEVDAQQLPAGYNFVKLSITNGANANFVSAVAILNGGRFTGDQSPTATS
jgi:hypothetical protein